MASGRPGDDRLIFPGRDGRPWSDSNWRNWRQRNFRKAVVAAGLPEGTRPYSLRHSFVSLLLAEGRTVVEVADQAGHSPTMALSTYAHVLDGLDGDRPTAEGAIEEARREKLREVSPGSPFARRPATVR